MSKIGDLSIYVNVLPYASEIFGVYQPLLGWKSKKIEYRIKTGIKKDKKDIIFRVFPSLFEPEYELTSGQSGSIENINYLRPAVIKNTYPKNLNSYIFDSILKKLPPLSKYNEAIWNDLIQPIKVQEMLSKVVVPKCMEWYSRNKDKYRRNETQSNLPLQRVKEQLRNESLFSGYLLYQKKSGNSQALKDMFYNTEKNQKIFDLVKTLEYLDPLDIIDPSKDIERAGLSPLGIVHLFRQYFFELDTFLGTPVSHVWLSPGSTVELVEISTRKTITEKAFEATTESVVKTEKSVTEEEELSDAVKEDNKSETKFGVNTTANQGWIGGSASASVSLDMGTTQSKSREVTHRHMRQQTEKLSTEIRKNYKSTFRTVTEVTDTSSKRYVLGNNTDELINYELRRKMRQVAVQVQDIGTYLCWQTFVDDPGKYLGISDLVHIAKGPEVGNIPEPEAPHYPEKLETTETVTIPFIPLEGDPELDDEDTYGPDGYEFETDTADDDTERIRVTHGPFEAICKQPGYEYAGIEFDRMGNDIVLVERDVDKTEPGRVKYKVKAKHINYHGNPVVTVMAKISWTPTEEHTKEIDDEFIKRVNKYNEQLRYEFHKSFVDAARERIKLMSKIESRKFEDLREEERIVVYRCLIQDMLTKNIPLPDTRTHHVVSELLNTIFDVDKMLYFVAPEWWRPRLHRSKQGLGGTGQEPGYIEVQDETGTYEKPGNVEEGIEQSVVRWGGVKEDRLDNYYITDESDPAKLGTSLGWLLQLDGDDLRNAFLNAPWVKAVIPIRPGKEKAAINWLSRVNVEGSEGLDDEYVAPPEQLSEIPHSGPKVTIRDAIDHLCEKVTQKHIDSLRVDKYPSDEINDDNKVSATPIDKVYEHGFYPLQGGFKLNLDQEFEIFDQWIEILPTDQVVPVEVKYDPKTGRQI